MSPLDVHHPFAEARRTAERLRGLLDVDTVDVAVVCGSGLGAFADTVEAARSTDMDLSLGFAPPSVANHAGRIVAGTVAGKQALVLAGRVHLYEGRSPAEVVHGVRVAAELGAKTLILTNAAGAVSRSYEVGNLVAISDHLNFTGANPLEGRLDDHRSRFVDMTGAYSDRLRALSYQLEPSMRSGVYACFRGPSYETPAEVRMAAGAGADLVGMSTALEAIAARHVGLEVAAFSLVTNLAAGISTTELSHTEVAEAGEAAAERVVDFLTRLIAAT